MSLNLTREDYTAVAEAIVIGKWDQFIPGPLSEADKKHIAFIAASVMMTRDGFLQGGSFVQAIIQNDLECAVTRADKLMSKCIPFMVYVKRNIRAELEIINYKGPEFENLKEQEA